MNGKHMTKQKGTERCKHYNDEGFRWPIHHCPNMNGVEGDKSMTHEHYECKVCGLTDSLDYDEMR